MFDYMATLITGLRSKVRNNTYHKILYTGSDVASIEYLLLPLDDELIDGHVQGRITGMMDYQKVGQGQGLELTLVAKVHGNPTPVGGVHRNALLFTGDNGPQWIDLGYIK